MASSNLLPYQTGKDNKVAVRSLSVDDAQKYRAICSFWRNYVSPTDQSAVRWNRFEDGVYLYLHKKCTDKSVRDFGVNDGPVLVYGLFLTLQKENEKQIDVIEEHDEG